MAEKTISLLQLRQHVKALDKLVTDAWFGDGHPASISFADVRAHAAEIAAMLADDSGAPHAATASSAPKAADNEAQKDAQKRADYKRAAADRKPAFDPMILGLYHVRKAP